MFGSVPTRHLSGLFVGRFKLFPLGVVVADGTSVTVVRSGAWCLPDKPQKNRFVHGRRHWLSRRACLTRSRSCSYPGPPPIIVVDDGLTRLRLLMRGRS